MMPAYSLNDPTQYLGVTDSPAIATDPGTIQNAVLARLRARQSAFSALKGVEIKAFPDDPENWRAVSQVGTVLVRWEGFEAREIQDLGIIVQPVKHRFAIGVLARGLGWSDSAGVSPQGAQPILLACLTALLGYRVPGCAKTYADKAEFIRRDCQGGLWVYALTVFVPTVIVETTDAETIPTFEEGIVNNIVGRSHDQVTTEGAP